MIALPLKLFSPYEIVQKSSLFKENIGFLISHTFNKSRIRHGELTRSTNIRA